jgi:membrane associated rhomboid family serine protease
MIPIKDYNPTERPAAIVPALIAINIIVFLFVQPSLGSTPAEQIRFSYCEAAIPYEITHRKNLVEAADDGDLGGPGVEVLRQTCPHKSWIIGMLQAMFFHGGILHIAGNMLFLWVFGNNVEDRLGRVRFTIFYLLCGILATLAQAYVTPNAIVPMVGASGAIAGVLGAYIIMYPRARIRNLVLMLFIFVVDLPAIVVLGIWFLLQVFQGVGDTTAGAGVAYMAHVGGFVAGMILLAVFRPRPRRAVPQF